MNVPPVLLMAGFVVLALAVLGVALRRRIARWVQSPRESQAAYDYGSPPPALDLEEDEYAEAGVVEEERVADDLGLRGVVPPAPAPEPAKAARMRKAVAPSEPAEEKAEPVLAAGPPAPTSVDIGGDVHGDVEVAGGHIIKTNGGNVVVLNNQEQALKYEKQARRFDAAFPDKVEHKKTATLWVGVAKPGDPPPFEGVPAETVTSGPTADIALPVDPTTGELKEVHIDVQVRAPQYEPSKDSASLTVYPDGRPDKVRFLLEAQDEGAGVILVQFYLDKKRLGEIELKSLVEKARAGQKFMFSLQVATLYFAFGVG